MSDEENNTTEYVPLKLEDLRIKKRDDRIFLEAKGTMPCENMEAELMPTMYIMQPKWWEISLQGHRKGGVCIEAVKEYAIEREISGDMGTEGFEIVCSDGTLRFSISENPVAGGQS